MRIPLWISNRHVHLSQIDCDKIFGKGYEIHEFKPVSQPGQFAAEELVTLVGIQGEIENVRVVGPNRKATQVEISKWDTFTLWVTAPIKMSWDLKECMIYQDNLTCRRSIWAICYCCSETSSLYRKRSSRNVNKKWK